MHVIIGSKAVKIFIKALKFLGKYSSDYILEAIDRKLELKVVCRNQVAVRLKSKQKKILVSVKTTVITAKILYILAGYCNI